MRKAKPPLVLKIRQSEDTLLVEAGEDRVQMKTSHPARVCFPGRADFAAWLFLPVAMRLNRPLHVEGIGSADTRRNFALLSMIWASWIPGHFAPVEVTFDEETTGNSAPAANRDLCFYSGGVDSTYTILRRLRAGQSQDLLTVWGMDYDLADRAKFDRFLAQTEPFAQLVGGERLIIHTDMYCLCKKYAVNIKHHHLTHIFSLAACGFLHAGAYRHLVTAADYRLDQQFLSHPWGNNSATNHLFDDGATRMTSDGDEVGRTDKLPLLSTSPEALASLSFCVDPASKPANCGLCPKCVRTKLMFLAATGQVPPVFAAPDIPQDWMRCFRYESPGQLAFLLDTVNYAKLHGRTGCIPHFAENDERLRAYLAGRRGFRNACRNRLLKVFKIGTRCQKWYAKVRRYAQRKADARKAGSLA